ncbi:sugar ABC transporter permease [Streptomyces mobaraensis NBRC 13819 = DSM 40847]|uniref:Xylose transport system permease protein XylH n=2 Tax=Streptomyces mobaraensis TaxID=35621 RepID=A0A5N5W7I7_STRMB|nr:ABC transporter permease [Streptomyces mobaraensis]EME99095.1 ABC transporter permease [Streptomyces mobaraensis NBRC 13819 = DSM 40847]KAB7843565.1 sugar ABC transporter permease [Streptomyces mobaraensis]QTT76193.1 sugar ABC transporter permease [Streptomyces mobaraensis NBRC 13819 = DSM 40847]
MTTDLSKTPEAPRPAAPAVVAPVDPRLLVREEGFAGYWSEFLRKLRSGELGSLPVVVGLIVICLVFQLQDSAFLGAENLSNLFITAAGTGLIAVGIVFVLILGEIDLSVGSVSGLAAAVFAVLNVNHGMPEWLALILAILTGTVAGVLHGFFFARIGVPAFVVTLAGLLGWNGLMLEVLGANGTINLDDSGLVAKLTNHYFEDISAAYGLATATVLAYFLVAWRDARRRAAAQVPSRPFAEIVLRTAALAVPAYAVAWVFNQYKGLPLAVVIFLGVVVALDLVLRRTRYGRKVFAVGGGVEAARRAGIDVATVRISVFALSGTMAALGGMFLASQINAANQSSGAGSLLMNAIAAAVIGGTSLFGGRGKTWSALLGVLVIQSIASGMALLGIASAVQYMITGAVLLAAVVIDSVSRRTQRTAGRA